MQDTDEPLFGGTPFRDAHTDSELAPSSDSRSYYALLNVDQDATESQIRDSYKTLASSYCHDADSSGVSPGQTSRR